MPDISNVHGTPFDEEKWQRAKERAKEEGHEGEELTRFGASFFG